MLQMRKVHKGGSNKSGSALKPPLASAGMSQQGKQMEGMRLVIEAYV